MNHFPFVWQARTLSAADFGYLQNRFSQSVLRLIPFAAGPVSFFDAVANPLESLADLNKPAYWQQYIKRVLRRQLFAIAAERLILFLPVWNDASVIGVAAGENVEKKFANTLSCRASV
ncbi:MAG: hypothetical protein R3297_07345 [Desulfobulbales bacterium]|nr:hypothetical protein [Desulfobulbales bacterium]